MDPNTVLNELVAALLPTLNRLIPPLMKNEGLDPWKEVVSDKETLGEVDLGLCTAKVEASYSIKDMVGLSSLFITNLTIATIDTSKLPVVTGTMSLTAKLNQNLSTKLAGKITAECGVFSESASISGKATAIGATGKGKVDYAANLSLPKACLTSMILSNLSFDYKDIKVEIDSLGFFNEFLAPLVDLIDVLFGDAIKGEIAKVSQSELNKLIREEIPFCISDIAA